MAILTLNVMALMRACFSAHGESLMMTSNDHSEEIYIYIMVRLLDQEECNYYRHHAKTIIHFDGDTSDAVLVESQQETELNMERGI